MTEAAYLHIGPLIFFRFEPTMYQESVLGCLLDYSEALEANS